MWEVVIIGHSKGGIDAAAALAMHEAQLADIVRGRGGVENNHSTDVESTNRVRTSV